MTKKEMINLFISTFLLFVLGFTLILIVETSIKFGSWQFYITTRVGIMILSGTILYFITNWKSLRLKKPLLHVKKHKEYIRYIKLRGLFVAAFTLIYIYYSRNGFENQEFLSSVLDTINKLFFHKEYKFFVIKFSYVSTSENTLFLTIIMIVTYLVLEYIFTGRMINNNVVNKK